MMMSKVNIVMDASQYDMFLLCPQRFHNRYNLNLQAPVKKMQLDRGTVVHVGAETYYEALKNGAKYQDAVVAALSKMREASVFSDLEPEMVDRCLDVMEEYFDYWRVADQSLNIVGVEQPFIYLLYEDDEVRIHMAGKIDLITSDNKYTNLPTDHKTYDRSFELTRMSNQFKNYTHALKSNYLVVNRIGFQKTLKPHEKFLRPMLSFDPLVFEQWTHNVVLNIMHYLQCAATNEWPMNETSCDKFHRKCEYLDACDASGIEAKMYKLSRDFVTVEPWDVSKVLRKATEVLADAQKAPEIQSEDGVSS
jgi:hypothetical protein